MTRAYRINAGSLMQRIENQGIGLERDEHGDKWGSSMGALFGIAHALYAADEYVPDAWQYRPAMGQGAPDPDEDYEAFTLTEAVDAGALTWDEVRRAGSILERYTRVLTRAGRDY